METQKHIEAYQELFDLMAKEHDLILLQSEMDEIILASQNVVKKYDLLADVSGLLANCPNCGQELQLEVKEMTNKDIIDALQANNR